MKKNKKNQLKKRNKADKITFNTSIYPDNIIKQAVEDFKEIADISLITDNKYIKAKIIARKSIKNIKWEFSNYVLALKMNQGSEL
ncbi:MAG: HxsD-like protein [Candidatus Woesearchaeota archaeon]